MLTPAQRNLKPEVVMNELHPPTSPASAGAAAPVSPSSSEVPPPAVTTISIDPLAWCRRIFAANPFYLASVVLLLYGIYRVTADSGFLTIETQQLFFNFSALQLYELALVGLAVFLARRLVWYDSTLLVLLENLLILVPFILVTQASLIDQRWIWGFCGVGVGLAAARVLSLRHCLSELNFPHRLLVAGGAVLAVNAVLPLVYRHLQEERMGRNITWGPAYEMNEWSWLAILPLLAACANLLPAPRSTGPLWPQRRWLPFALFSSWLVASSVHLYALSYVYTFQMRAALWAPLLLVLAWTLQRQVQDYVAHPGGAWRIALLLVPFPLPALALCSKDTAVALVLLGMNAGLYGWTAGRGQPRALALHLAWASGISALACVPATGILPALSTLSPGDSFAAAAIGYVLLASVLSRRVTAGLFGALAVVVALGMAIPLTQGGLHCALQGGLMFLLLHSLRWDDAIDRWARILRWIAAAVWGLQALVWAAAGGPVWEMAGIGAGVLLTGVVVGWLQRARPPWPVAIGALTVMLSGPAIRGLEYVKTAPAGLLAVGASFLLLGVGTLVALTKHRWHRLPHE
jgi:hypothetical protein